MQTHWLWWQWKQVHNGVTMMMKGAISQVWVQTSIQWLISFHSGVFFLQMAGCWHTRVMVVSKKWPKRFWYVQKQRDTPNKIHEAARISGGGMKISMVLQASLMPFFEYIIIPDIGENPSDWSIWKKLERKSQLTISRPSPSESFTTRRGNTTGEEAQWVGWLWNPSWFSKENRSYTLSFDNWSSLGLGIT